MSDMNAWQYNEYQQIGTDYQDVSTVQVYEEKMSKFRNFQQEARSIMKYVHLKPEHTLLEIGTGTGNFAIEAARHCRQVYAIDVSQVMVDVVQEKIHRLNLSNLSVKRAGFLDYEPPEMLFDVVVSKLALHHLPDFWKMVALHRIFKLLKPGGYFYLEDVVFSFPIAEYAEKLPQWVTFVQGIDADLASETEAHAREEFSTCDWIIEEVLVRTGFEYTLCKKDSYFAAYCCQKPSMAS